MKSVSSFLAVACAAAFFATAADWPRFRGPDGAGIGDAPGVPLPWTEANQLWIAKLPGVGHSSPAVVGSRLFVTCTEIATAKRMVLCLDSASGATNWLREFPSKTYQQNNDNSYASASPAADAEGVVVTWTTPDEVLMVALDNSGKEIWRRSLGPFICNHGSGSSPIIVGDVVVLSNDQDDPTAAPQNYSKPDSPKTPGKSFVIALDRKTGETRWQLDRKSNQASFATPAIRKTESGALEIVCASTAHGLTGIDATTGKINWNGGGEFKKRCVGSPACGAGVVVQTEGSGGMGARLVAVKPGAKTEIVYELQKPLPYVPCPLIVGEKLYLWGDNGQIACLKAATGEAIWREKIEGSFYCSPICVNGRIVCISKSGDVFVLGGGDKFEVIGKIPLGEKCFATPAVAEGKIFIRTYSQLIAIGRR